MPSRVKPARASAFTPRVILSTCLMQAVIGRLAIMDALLDLAVAMTIFWWFRGLETGRGRYIIYGWIAAAAGFLAKGLVAPVVALLVDRAVPFLEPPRRSDAAPFENADGFSACWSFLRSCCRGRSHSYSHYGFFPFAKL